MAMSNDVIDSSPGKSFRAVMDDDVDEKDDVKRKSRNLSEKKRRDQFNLLINELSSMVASNNRKMDKSTVLKATIAFLKNQKACNSPMEYKFQYLINNEPKVRQLCALANPLIIVSCFTLSFSKCGTPTLELDLHNSPFSHGSGGGYINGVRTVQQH
ncbi:circadian locomoter output cycles protein kaput-like [Palaemon carinicauda]|uniref:circadian locomoter output cycles protein kaput-like n=1 Tax=Palaemon carinicauda TaxID=392227 RepID=UPI0035B57E82